MHHLFTFLVPRNLNRTTLELFFSLNQRLSIWPFGRRDVDMFSSFYRTVLEQYTKYRSLYSFGQM